MPTSNFSTITRATRKGQGGDRQERRLSIARRRKRWRRSPGERDGQYLYELPKAQRSRRAFLISKDPKIIRLQGHKRAEPNAQYESPEELEVWRRHREHLRQPLPPRGTSKGSQTKKGKRGT